jgi:N-acetylglucosaminyl-diphospho-decaprenol L-rhamnosyltransferase
MMQNGFVEVVVVTRNSGGHIGPCVESIVKGGALPIIVDNGSMDDTLEIARSRCPEAKIIATGENLGYGKAMNLGFKETSGDFVILSNPDVVFLGDSISQMVEFLKKNPGIGVTGPQQMFPDRSWQRSYGDLSGLWGGFKNAIGITSIHNWVRRMAWPIKVDRRPKEVPYVDGGVLCVRREAFLGLGGFDEAFYFYGEESDFCARLKKVGWRVVFLPKAQVIHARGASSMQVDRADRFLRLLIGSQAQLARKHLPTWKLPLYMRLERMGFRRLALTHRLLKWFVPASHQAEFDAHIWRFETYRRLWDEEIASGSPLVREAP